MAKKNFKKASGKSYEKSHAKKPQDPNLVKAKKFLGQHFLEDETVAQRIAETLTGKGYKKVLEIGPGMGVLTKYLLQNKDFETYVVEIDTESVDYLKSNYLSLAPRIIEKDFLKHFKVFYASEELRTCDKCGAT